jgi:hypothetical protein
MRRRPLLAAAGETRPHPEPEQVAVLRPLEPEGTGDLVWMPDERTFCVMALDTDAAPKNCFDLPPAETGHVRVWAGTPHDLAVTQWWAFAVVENVVGRFDYTRGFAGEGVMPVQQATVRLPSGRAVTFIAYGLDGGRTDIPLHAEICGPRHEARQEICFNPFEHTDDWR